MISDAFDTEEAYDGYVIKCKSAMIVKGACKIDIGDSLPVDGEQADDQDETVNNVVDGFCMVGMAMKKSEFQTYIKGFMGKMKKRLDETAPDRTAGFMKAAQGCVKYLLGKFEDLEFYLGDEDPTMDGHLGMACWDDVENDTAPTFYFFKDALK